ncbi:MAG TPA: hypothetical protein VLJ79_06550 [Candidatus Binatia bacterium]|nr:hypothetical protein [Candidatus Binatia bacterium]
MIKKLAAFIVLTFLLVPFASLAQSPTGSGSGNLKLADIADESIVVLSTDQGGMAGYVHQQYAFRCFGQWEIVDYYGAPIDPKDRNILRTERRLCSQRTFGDDGSED